VRRECHGHESYVMFISGDLKNSHRRDGSSLKGDFLIASLVSGDFGISGGRFFKSPSVHGDSNSSVQ
jgi:hypothetical protein